MPAGPLDGALVAATDVCVHYGSVVALAPSSLELAAGTATALVGPNGSGKSTLLNVLAGLVRPTSGRVEIRAGTRIAFVAQQQHQHSWMPLSVADVLQMGRYGERGLLGRMRAADRRAIAEAADRLVVGDLRRRQYGELSGGQRQRVLVAQALATEPDLLLLDEPITGLDLVSQDRILRIIDEETAAGTTVVLSTHHLGEAERADVVMLLAGCLLAAGPPAEVLRPDLLGEAFGTRIVRDDGSTVLVDDHGHAHDDCPDGEPESASLLGHHHHDHHAHAHVDEPGAGEPH
ncbi:MAG: metal ABC transporter ATP-binding protein [Ilumatobacteraceae bacterium]